MAKNRCPECGKEVKLKEGRYGLFYGCSGFPKCRFTADSEVSDCREFDVDQWEEYELNRELNGYLLEIING